MTFLSFFTTGLILLGLQTLLSNLFFSGNLVVELSLILVIYAGFNLTWARGGILSFIIGFLMDCLMGSVSGLFALSYLVFFLLANIVSTRVYAERFAFIMGFVGLCVFIEGILIASFYRLTFDMDMFHHLGDIFLPQAIIAGLLAPWFFTLFRRLGDLHSCRNYTRG